MIPKVSIIIPAYNEEKYLGSCLSSIFSQKTKHRYEVIVVDNNSQDATSQVAAKFAVRLVLEKKPGATAARNKGAKLAKAKILYFLDADCRLPPGQIERVCQAFVEQPQLAVVAGPYIYDQDGWLPYLVTKTFKYFLFYHRLLKIIFGINTFPGGNFAIKKRLFQEVGGFDESICNQEIVLPDDLDLAIRLHQKGIDKVLFAEKYQVFSSFRRFKKAPLKNALVRTQASVSLLLRDKLKKIKVNKESIFT